jgi:hypothetical protein
MQEYDLAEDLSRSAALLTPCHVVDPGPAWRAAEADGWDMSHVLHKLSLTAQQRMREHNYAIRQALEMRAAFQAQYGRPGAAY